MMSDETKRPSTDEVEQLMRNAQLRTELEPFLDESITRLDLAQLPTPEENAYLESMLAWERAPVLPIHKWFDPPLELPNPAQLEDAELERILWNVIYQLYEQHIVLDFTAHLSDRRLYSLIVRDILPSLEKKLDGSDRYLHWDCADICGDAEIWLRYYATDEERTNWAQACNEPLPPREDMPYPRPLPQPPS